MCDHEQPTKSPEASLLPNKKSKSQRTKPGQERPVALPQFSANQTVSTKFRYQVTSPGSYGITVQNILRACGGIATTPLAFQAWASSVRLKRVRVFAIDTAIPVTLQFRWGNGGWVGPTRDLLITDSSLGVTFPGVIDTRPPDGSLAKMWMSYQAGHPDDTVFDLVIVGSSNTRAFIDIDVEYMLDSSNPSVQQVPQLAPISTSLNIGSVYWPSLVPSSTDVNQITLPSFS